MNKVVIVGAGGLGREVYSWIQNANQCKSFETLEVVGFVDDRLDALDKYDYPIKVISQLDSYVPRKNEHVIVAMGQPSARKNLVEKLIKLNANFLSFIHPSAIIDQSVRLGRGALISPGVIIKCDSHLGDFVFMNNNSTVGHDVQIGNYATLSGKVEVTSFNKVGDCVMFGVGSITIPGIVIESEAVIGAGSIVIKKVKSKSTVFGNPAKMIRISNE